MKRILIVLALVASSTILGTSQAAAAELAVNGGFETGSLSPWSCTGNLGSVVSSPVHSGGNALRGNASSADNAKCTQTVTGLVSGTSYTLSGWFQGSYTFLGYTGGNQTWRSGSSYGKLSLTFTASSSSVEIYFHGWYGQGAYYADDISLLGEGDDPPPDDTTPPSNVSGLTSPSQTTSSISLSWNAATDNVGIAGYNIYRNGSSTPTAQTNGTGTSYTDSGLASDTSYTYTVRARDAAGNVSTGASNQITVSTDGTGGGDTTPPSVPGNLRVTGTNNNSVGLAWNASSDNVGVSGYDVYRGSTLVDTVSGTSFTDTGLATCTDYSYRVRARDAAGNVSGNSNTVTGSTTGCTGGGGDKVLGYFIQWGVYGRNYHVKNVETSGSADKLTHINYAFGNVTGGRCTIGDAYADYDKFYNAAQSVNGVSDTWEPGDLRGNFGQLKALKEMHPNIKILWSFGGWTWSGGFGQAAANPQAFADSCYNLVHDPRWEGVFDGIDIDWEYPNACGLSCDTSGFDSFRVLMQALRNRFGNELVTAAITADGTPGGKIDAADYAGAAQYVDWYNVMTYDFFGAWAAQGPTAPHSPLTCWSGMPVDGFCTATAIAKLKSKGIPASKLLLGIGFYGRGWTGVTQSAPGGTATGAAPGTYEAGIEDYKVISSRCPSTGTFAGTAYAYCGNQWWSYDTPATIRSKMNWLKGQGLGGAFFWELSGDTTNGTLITAIDSGLG